MNVPVMGSEQRVKKRRGRPRKYEPGSGEASLGFVPGPPSYTVSQPSGGDGGGGGASPSVKRMRGRPSGSSNRPKLQALGKFLYTFFFYWNLLVGLDLLCRLLSIRI